MFSALQTILLRPLPYAEPDRIVVLNQTDQRNAVVENGVSAANSRDIARGVTGLSSLGVAEAHGLRLIEDGKAVSLRGWLVSEGFFAALGAETKLGRMFRAEDYTPGRASVVLLSHRAWLSRFGGEASVVGRDQILDGRPHRVVGVLPESFAYPSGADVWGPRPAVDADERVRGRVHLDAVARLSDEITLSQAQSELTAFAQHLADTYPTANPNLDLRLVPLREHLLGDTVSPLLMLMGAVGIVLLISATNVAGLQLARGAQRGRDIALRRVLGASPGRILRLVSIESLLLAGGGGMLGAAGSFVAVEMIRELAPSQLPRIEELRFDTGVLGFAMLASLASAIIAGIAPALRASRVGPQQALAEALAGYDWRHPDSQTQRQAGHCPDRCRRLTHHIGRASDTQLESTPRQRSGFRSLRASGGPGVGVRRRAPGPTQLF